MQQIYKNLEASGIELAPGQLIIAANYHLYNCFMFLVRDIDQINVDEFSLSLQRLLASYLSIQTNTLHNQLSFVYTFYQSYLLFEVEDSLTSLSDTTSAIHDNTFEAKLGMILAIAESIFPNMPDEILDNLLKLTNS